MFYATRFDALSFGAATPLIRSGPAGRAE